MTNSGVKLNSYKSIDDDWVGIWTWARWMEGADETY